MRWRMVILVLVFGVAMNFASAWFCMWRHEAGDAAAESKLVGTVWEFGGWRSYGQTPIGKTSLPLEWPADVPSNWPSKPDAVEVEEFPWMTKTLAFSASVNGTSLRSTQHVFTTTAGWPTRCWRSMWLCEIPSLTGTRSTNLLVNQSRCTLAIPLGWQSWVGVRNIPIGIQMWLFIVNTAFYSLCIGIALFGMSAVRRLRRVRSGECAACGYPIGVSPVCTECGRAVEATLAVRG